MITFIVVVWVLFMGFCLSSGVIGFLFELFGKKKTGISDLERETTKAILSQPARKRPFGTNRPPPIQRGDAA